MSHADEDRKHAAEYAPGDVLSILYDHHATIRDALDRVKRASEDDRANRFDELKGLLHAHETAEQEVVRPITLELMPEVGQQRTGEEREADEVLAKLSSLDVTGDDFDAEFADFMQAVSDHAEAEEHGEFPVIRQGRDEAQRTALGESFLDAFRAAGGAA